MQRKFCSLLALLLTCALFILGSGCSNTSPEVNPNAKNVEVFSLPGEQYANTYILASAGQAAVVDPVNADEISRLLTEKNLKPVQVFLTHGHFDHIIGVPALLDRYPGLPVMINKKDAGKLADPRQNASASFGLGVTVEVKTKPLSKGEVIKLGNASITVLETPGHTKGSVCLLVGKDILLTGDTLFKGSVGRTDLSDGNPTELKQSLSKLTTLPDDTKVYPGHGEGTSIGAEKQSNDFLK